VTTDPFAGLAAELRVGLYSPGLCLACLTFVAFEDERDERAIRRRISEIAAGLWEDGFGATVRAAVESAARDGVDGASDALRDLEARTFRSAIFRAVIRRLSIELRENARRSYAASLN
jgi:hypothetical protein